MKVKFKIPGGYMTGTVIDTYHHQDTYYDIKGQDGEDYTLASDQVEIIK